MQLSQSKYWCFTLNNYTESEIEIIVQVFDEGGFKYVMGKEVGEEGTPHIQGYVEHEKRFRPSELKFGELSWNRLHWEKRRGSGIQATQYCMKDGDYSTNIRDIKEPLVKMERKYLTEKQCEIADRFIERAHPLFSREIFWFWEPRGNWGKTKLAMHMVDYMGALLVGGAKKDALCAVAAVVKERGVPIVIFDLPRGEKPDYRAIEAIKNGIFFSAKYESGMCRFNRPHVIVFSNQPPDLRDRDGEETLSPDRWKIEPLSGSDQRSSTPTGVAPLHSIARKRQRQEDHTHTHKAGVSDAVVIEG